MASNALTATALSLAALRETAEESGIFLCKADGAHGLSVKEQEQAQADRDAGLDFYEILQRRNWKPDLNLLKRLLAADAAGGAQKTAPFFLRLKSGAR